jgi:NAD(P)-dependent dehydrogenase (short-subunit alcohol dehydrogenase family)
MKAQNVALVTGSSSGIGFETAVLLANYLLFNVLTINATPSKITTVAIMVR